MDLEVPVKMNKMAKLKMSLLLLVGLLSLMIGATATEAYMLTVNVYDTNYKHITANVVVKNMNGIIVASTSGQSPFFFVALPKGDYTVTASAPNYKEGSTFVAVDGIDDVADLILEAVGGGNRAPIAAFTYTVSDLTVNVDASASSDPDGDTLTYNWDFGDGTIGSGKTAVHTYASAGAYTIKLTVDDGKGGVDTESILVTLQMSSDIQVHDLDFKDEVAPGSEVEFELELKNNATYDAEDVEATIIIQNIDDGDDIEKTIDFGDLDKGDRQSETTTITIPANADNDKYAVEVKLTWYDAAGKQYSSTYTSPDKLEVVKPKHQVLITNLQTDAASYEAGDVVQVMIAMLNTGANDENVQLKITSSIGSATSATIPLKEGDSSTQYLSFVIPAGTKAGKYAVTVSAVYSGYTTTKSFILTVAAPEIKQETAVTLVEATTEQPKEGMQIPATELALGLIILLLAAIIVWFGKDLMTAQSAKPLIAKTRGK
ncbi:MAG: PKD domain-containing protein [Candidatus Nanoarchaeia archaeon]